MMGPCIETITVLNINNSEQELYGLSQVAYEAFKTDKPLSQVLCVF